MNPRQQEPEHADATRLSPPLLNDRGALDEIEPRKVASEIVVPLTHDQILSRSQSGRRSLAIGVVQRLGDSETVDHLGDRRESAAVSVELRVVLEIDEQLHG